MRRPSGPALRPLAWYVLPPAIALSLAAAVCEAWTRLANVPTYIFPAPSAVLARLFGDAGYFAVHGAVTVVEAAAGFVLGSAIAVALGVAMSYSRAAERTLLPIALLVKVTPVVAVAPLFVIWFGFGSGPKVLIAALITFFPVMVNTLIGLRSVSPGALDFLRSLDASDMEILLKLRAPSALPYLFAAFRIAVPLSVIGAVVGGVVHRRQGSRKRDNRRPQQHRHAHPLRGRRHPRDNRCYPYSSPGVRRTQGALLA